MDTRDYVKRVYADVDTMDVRKLLEHLTEDCAFVFGNAEPLSGHAAIEVHVGGFMGMIAGMAHEIEDVWRVDDVVIVRTKVTYTRKDRSQVSYPAAIILRLRGDRICEFRIYVDNSTLFNPS